MRLQDQARPASIPPAERSPEGAQRIPGSPARNNLSPDFISFIRATRAEWNIESAMTRARGLGFSAAVDSGEMFARYFAQYRAGKIVP